MPFLNFRALYRFSNDSNDGEIISGSYMRTGCMAAFDNFDHFQQYSDEILDLLEDFASPASVHSKVMDAVEAADSLSEGGRLSTSINVSLSDPVTRSAADGGENSK